MNETCSDCGHPFEEHADSGWGPRTVCTRELEDGWYGVCPCVRTDGDQSLGTAEMPPGEAA